MFEIVLYQPQIAPNTGNIIRLSANNHCRLHLVEPLGFSLEDKQLRRAGLDYHDLTHVLRYPGFDEFLKSFPDRRVILSTTRAQQYYSDFQYQPGDCLLFGSETRGVPEIIHQKIIDEHKVTIPMRPGSRSLNLSNAVAIVSYEAWRQCGFSC